MIFITNRPKKRKEKKKTTRKLKKLRTTETVSNKMILISFVCPFEKEILLYDRMECVT